MKFGPQPPSRMPEPYRILFPLGVLFGLAGAVLWPLHAAGRIPYPGPLHAALMIQGFEHCFILGFFLTALPGFTHGARCHAVELGAAVAGMLAFGALALAGAVRPAEIAFVLTVVLLLVAAARRMRASGFAPPEEFLFVLLGLALGLAGGLTLAATAGPGFVEAPPRLGFRLVSLGMVLSLVLGFGGLLVPTFIGTREPLAVPGIARAGERGPRRPLYRGLAALFVAAFAAEALGMGALGAGLRAAVATAIGLLVWKLFRLPGRRGLLSFSLWTAGWLILAGLWAAALLPLHAAGAMHVTLIGGFGLLTAGIATRVVVSHGGHPPARERLVLSPIVVAGLALALAARLAAEFAPGRFVALMALAGALWVAAWLAWGAAAAPAVLATRRPPGGGLVPPPRGPATRDR